MTDEHQIDGTTVEEKLANGNIAGYFDEADIAELAAALDAQGNDITGVGSFSTDLRDITDENAIEARGANGNLLESYPIADYADIGAAINQAVSDGAAVISAPVGDYQYSTEIVIDVDETEVEVPTETTLTYSGTGAGATIRDARNCRIEGGRWVYDGAEGGAGNVVGIRAVADTSPVANPEVKPHRVNGFYAGIKLYGQNSGCGYARTNWEWLRDNQIGLWVRSENSGGWANAGLHFGNRIDAAGVTAPEAVRFEAAGDDISSHNFFGLTLENLDVGFNIAEGTVAGVVGRGVYFEVVNTHVQGNSEEVYLDKTRAKHIGREIDMGSRQFTTLHRVHSPNSTGATVLDLDRHDGRDNPAGLYVSDEGTPKAALRDNGNLRPNHDNANGYEQRVKRVTVGNGDETTIDLADLSAQSSAFQGVVEIMGNCGADTVGMYRKEHAQFHDNTGTIDSVLVDSEGTQGSNTGITMTGSPGNLRLTIDNDLGAFGFFTVIVRADGGEMLDW